jgi:hypothetical protein
VKASKKTSTRHKYAELLNMASFYKRAQPNLHTLDLLKIMGFHIAGLRRRFGRVLPSPRPHVLVWNPTLQWGICLCGKWEAFGMEQARARHGHQIHERLASRDGCEGLPAEVLSMRHGKLKSRSRMATKWRMQCRCSSHKALTTCRKEE